MEIDAVSLVALIISIIALIGAILQLLQQYVSSAEGFSNCGEQALGPWALYRVRKFRWSELRFEVQFEAPVIFLCPPSNTRGPVPNQELLFVQGTDKSENDTRTPSFEAEKKAKDQQRESKKANQTVHTADNERATWFILLQALQAMERTSMDWQRKKLMKDKVDMGPKLSAHLPEEVAPWSEHSLVVALQPKRKSWDTMPAEVRKPYATTTICHMVEMAAMLGLHWRAFDRSNHKYHAEGNGFLLTGHEIDGLGIMFHFQIYAANKFESHRVIPNNQIKMLAFGDIMTIYKPDAEEKSNVDYDDEDLKSSGKLQLGSINELVESLTYYGCNSKTTNYFRDDKAKHGALFPIVFELLGMVGETLYLPNTYYRFIPNPTTFSWNRKNFSLRKLLLEYSYNMQDDNIVKPSYHIYQVQDWAKSVGDHLKNWADKSEFPMSLLRSLHQTIEKCDKYLTADEMMKKTVLLVVRLHIQEVMKQLNEPRPQQKDGSSSSDDNDDSMLTSKDGRALTFEDLNSAAPEVRQSKLMQIYFRSIRSAVIKNCPTALKKRTTHPYIPSVASRSDLDMTGGGFGDEDDGTPAVSPMPRAETPQLLVSGEDEEKHLAGAKLRNMPTEREEELAEDVWCTLVLRMLCWLLLHDFHKKDVQIGKSELYQSRLPVYLA